MKFALPPSAGNSQCRHFCLILLIVLILPLANLSAQLGMLLGGRGPIKLGLRYNSSQSGEIHQGIAEFSRTMPLRASAGSYMSYLNFALGYRFDTIADTTFIRWRAGILKMNMMRKNLAIGLSLVYYDKSGFLHENVQWVNLKIGPGFTVGNRRFSLSPKVQVSAGPGKKELGQANYPAFGALADSTLRGLEAGYHAEVAMRIGRRIFLNGDYSNSVMIDTPEPHFDRLGISAVINIARISNNTIVFHFRYLRETVEINNADLRQENDFFKAGINVILGRTPQSKKPSWENF